MKNTIGKHLVFLLQSLIYNSKLKYKLIIPYSLLVTVVVLFTGLVSRYFFIGYLLESERKAINNDMNQLNNTIDYFLEIYMNRSDMLFGNLNLQRILTKENTNMKEMIDTYVELEETTSQVLNDFRYPFMKNSYYFGGIIKASFYLINDTVVPDGNTILSFNDVKDEAWVKELSKPKVMFSWRSKVYFKGADHIAMNRKLMNFKTYQPIGILTIYIPTERVENIIESNNEGNKYNFVYLDNENNVIVSTGNVLKQRPEVLNELKKMKLENGIRNIELENENYIVGCINSSITGWKLIYMTSLDAITSKVRFVDMLTLLTILISVSTCIIISIIISSFITKRVNVLVKKTNSITNQNITYDDIELKGEDEIGQLDKNFNSMIKRINELIEKEYISRIVINKTKFELLQEQINPHMLYNTLSMIGYTAKKVNQHEIVDTTNSLISFYRGILNEGRIVSSLRSEINMIKRYVDIARFVYTLDIDIEYNIDEEILDYYSIKLFLQPIVENSIIHGIRPLKSGSIVICSKVVDDRIYFTVSDSGIGISEEEVKYLNSLGRGEISNKSYGLSNVVYRIKLFFGDSYGVKFDSSPEEGTTVEIVIPKLTEEQIKYIIDDKYL